MFSLKKIKIQVINFVWLRVYTYLWMKIESPPQWRVSLDWVVELLKIIPLIFISINVGIFMQCKKTKKTKKKQKPVSLYLTENLLRSLFPELQLQSGFTCNYHRCTLTNDKVWDTGKTQKDVRHWATDPSLVIASGFLSEETLLPYFETMFSLKGFYLTNVSQ